MLTNVSNGALISAYTASNVSVNGHNNLLIAGTNIEAAGTVTSNSATSSNKTTFWVAGFSDVSTGNVTTQGDAAITCDRTQWFS
jgi:hypothetical protein